MTGLVSFAIERPVLCLVCVMATLTGIFAFIVGFILPRLIRRAEMKREADDSMLELPENPIYADHTEEYLAWLCSDTEEQGPYRRIGKTIPRRAKAERAGRLRRQVRSPALSMRVETHHHRITDDEPL